MSKRKIYQRIAAEQFILELQNNDLETIVSKRTIGTFEGYPIVAYPDMLHAYGLSIAGFLKTLPPYDEMTIIIVDNDFMMMDKSYKQWLLSHELGHIECKHYEHPEELMVAHKNSIYDLYILKHVSKFELEADEWASNNTSTSIGIETLKYMRKRLHVPWLTRRELKLRINALSKK